MSPRADPKRKVEYRRDELVVHIPDTRGVRVSPWGLGNLKLGPGIYTYSKLPGLPQPHGGSCPGATDTCLRVCYAFRVRETPLVWDMWTQNTKRDCLPWLPRDAQIIRIHVSGDFASKPEIRGWWAKAGVYPRVRFFAYTRSWRVPELLPDLEKLQALDNVQLFASVDASNIRKHEWPPEEWRWAWLGAPSIITRVWQRQSPTYTCPETTGRKANCEECRYCIDGKRGDVVFPIH